MGSAFFSANPRGFDQLSGGAAPPVNTAAAVRANDVARTPKTTPTKKKAPRKKTSWLGGVVKSAGKVAGNVAKATVKNYTGIKL